MAAKFNNAQAAISAPPDNAGGRLSVGRRRSASLLRRTFKFYTWPVRGRLQLWISNFDGLNMPVRIWREIELHDLTDVRRPKPRYMPPYFRGS
jgi:hypothetical protein